MDQSQTYHIQKHAVQQLIIKQTNKTHAQTLFSTFPGKSKMRKGILSVQETSLKILLLFCYSFQYSLYRWELILEILSHSQLLS